MANKLIYFIGSDLRIGEQTLNKVAQIEGHERTYSALSGMVLPSDGYVAQFDVRDEMHALDVKRQLTEIKGVERLKLIGFGRVIE
jgi:hypothetical protein